MQTFGSEVNLTYFVTIEDFIGNAVSTAIHFYCLSVKLFLLASFQMMHKVAKWYRICCPDQEFKIYSATNPAKTIF